MRAFAIHRNMFTIAILWWRIVCEEPRCRHFDAACGRRFGYGTRSPRACGFPFDAWEDTFLHCAAALRSCAFTTLQPYIPSWSSCRCPDDVADVLQIQYHLSLNHKAEAEDLIASALARNPGEMWFLYASSELGEHSALSALQALVDTLEPGHALTPQHPLVDRIVRNCYKSAYWTLARGLEAATADLTPNLLRLSSLLGANKKVNFMGTPSDSPDQGVAWAVLFQQLLHAISGSPMSPSLTQSPLWQQAQDDLMDHLYGDISERPRWLSRVIQRHTSEATSIWSKRLSTAFRFDSWIMVGHGERLHVDYARVFNKDELVAWNCTIFDHRHQQEPVQWKLIPKRVWVNLVHPVLRPGEMTERCHHCNVPSVLLQRCSLCREIQYCGSDW
ncbi:hypothetical protein AURDEDRAFT_150895 [Auricularia subglabra TFB-10046 SS5]|nr:hypothetical protein AURDEDRAFT_150895 [Auricularia subglabra TFB-10046 SS5]